MIKAHIVKVVSINLLYRLHGENKDAHQTAWGKKPEGIILAAMMSASRPPATITAF